MKKIIAVCILLFIGCDQKPEVKPDLSLIESKHPQSGDYYEHKATLERVRIEFIGAGKDAHKYCEEEKVNYKKMTPENMQISTANMETYSESDSNETCIVFKTSHDPLRPHWWITRIEYFNKDYKLVE